MDNQLETNNVICVIIYDDIHTIIHFSIYPVLKSYHEGGLMYEL
jgi:hypothetical protein